MFHTYSGNAVLFYQIDSVPINVYYDFFRIDRVVMTKSSTMYGNVASQFFSLEYTLQPSEVTSPRNNYYGVL